MGFSLAVRIWKSSSLAGAKKYRSAPWPKGQVPVRDIAPAHDPNHFPTAFTMVVRPISKEGWKELVRLSGWGIAVYM